MAKQINKKAVVEETAVENTLIEENEEIKDEVKESKAPAVEPIVEPIESPMDKEIEILKDELKRRDEELKRRDAEQSEMKAQLTMLMQMLQNQQAQQQTVAPQPVKEENADVEVGCRMFSGLGMASSDGQQLFFKCGEHRYIPYDEMKSFLRESSRNNKALFANGLLYFYNEEDYDRFKIRKKVDLSEEAVIEILSREDTNEMIRGISQMTADLRKTEIVFALKFMIAEMLIREPQKLAGFSYNNRKALEDYFEVTFDTLIANAGMYRFLKAE